MIPAATLEVMRECSQRSFENIPFPEVVQKLTAAGVESYHTDLFRHERTYYMPGGDSHVVPEAEKYAAQLNAGIVAPELNAEAVQNAVRQIQQKQIGYLEFLALIMKAGVSSYSVYIRGRRAIYCGRTGDQHVEWFPGSR